MGAEQVLFYSFAAISVVSAVAMVLFVRNIVAGAMSLVVTMISLAGVYVLLEAHLVAVIQIMVYAGAILVLFLFVIMLLNIGTDSFGPARPYQVVFKTIGAVGLLLVAATLGRRVGAGLPTYSPAPEGFGGYAEVGVQLFTRYAVPVEVAGFMLLAAIVGAVVLAKRRID
jgi:NADH-quinone oxidoreductase subunit J